MHMLYETNRRTRCIPPFDRNIDYLYTEIGFTPSGMVADIGAGTGIFSKLLTARGAAVVCVEPNAACSR